MKKSLMKTTLLGLGFSLFSLSAQSAVFNVTDSASLQTALTAAEGSVEDDTINLAAGTYLLSQNIVPGQTFSYDSTEVSSLTLQGAGIGQTILDGEGSNRVMQLIAEPTNANKTISVSGITFRNGLIEESMLDDGIGGGLFVGVDPSFQVSIQDSEFLNNQASSGGGLAVFTGSEGLPDPLSVFRAEFDTLTFTNNQALAASAFDLGAGGFLVVYDVVADMSFNRIVATGNSSLTFGGAGVIGGVFRLLELPLNNDQIVFTNSYLVGNTSGYNGAGMLISDLFLDLEFTNNIILKNTINFTQSLYDIFIQVVDAEDINPAGAGFALADTTGTVQIVQNTIASNTIQNEVESVDTFGGGVAVVPHFVSEQTEFTLDTLNIYNNIIYGNQAENGADIALLVPQLDEVTPGLTIPLKLKAKFEQMNPIPIQGNGPLAVNLFNNDYTDYYSTCDVIACGIVINFADGGNIDLNPVFQDLANDNVHLGVGSPAIDAGDPTAPAIPPLDFDGNVRPFGSAPDMGALEAIPDIEVTPLAHNFGVVNPGDSETVEIQIANVGVANLDVTALSLQQANTDFSFDLNGGSDPCGATTFVLAGGESCTVTAAFAPDAQGDQSNILNVASNDPDEAVVPVSLLGTTPDGYLEGSGTIIGCSLQTGAIPFQMSWAMVLIPALLFGIQRRRVQ